MRRLIYFDNAATSYPKPRNVIESVGRSLYLCGNPGRSSHELSLYSARQVYACREALCDFFNFNHPENIVFTYNTTYALNMAIKGLAQGGDEILISNLEHNSVSRPIAHLTRDNRQITFKKFHALTNDDELISNFEKAITPKTRLCVITMCSNVTGKILPIRKIGEICKARRLKLIFDAAQCAGIIPIDLSSLYFSAICFASHKSLCGIMGSGFCIFAPRTNPQSIIQGGNGTLSASLFHSGPLPELLEAGTPGVPAIIALYEGIRHINSVGISEIYEKTRFLERRLYDGLSQMKSITLYSNDKNKVSTLLFNAAGIPGEKLSMMLSGRGICTRAGLHCSALAHTSLGTLDTGAVRVSLSHFNTLEETDVFLKEIEQITK